MTEEAAGAAEETPELPEASTPATLATDSTADLGAFLTDGQGRSLYIFAADSARQSTCYDACTAAWPPLKTAGAPTIIGSGIREDLIGTIERRDGTTQVTYNGWPLYSYASDPGPGERMGHDIEEHGARWHLLSPSGEPIHAGIAGAE